MTWVRATELGKRVNLDHAASAKQTVKGEWQLFTADGRSLGVVDEDPFHAAAMSADEQIAEIAPRRPQPAYLPDATLAALRADARRSLVRRTVVS